MVVRRALAEDRPFLIISLLLGLGYILLPYSSLPGLYQIIWKGCAVGSLAIFAARRVTGVNGLLLTAGLALSAIGDMLVEIVVQFGAIAFVWAMVAMIALYVSNRRKNPSFSQMLFAFILLVLTPVLALMLTGQGADIGLGAYAIVTAIMASSAWISRFSRYRVGAGAVLILTSNMFSFAQLGLGAAYDILQLVTWPLYYIGQLLVCTGIVKVLRQT